MDGDSVAQKRLLRTAFGPNVRAADPTQDLQLIIGDTASDEVPASLAINWISFREARDWSAIPRTMLQELLDKADTELRDATRSGDLKGYGRRDLKSASLLIPSASWVGAVITLPDSALAHKVGKQVVRDFLDVRFLERDMKKLWPQALVDDVAYLGTVPDEHAWRKLSAEKREAVRKRVRNWYVDFPGKASERADVEAAKKIIGDGVPRQLIRDIRKEK